MKKAFFLFLFFLLTNILFCYNLTLISEGEANYIATNWLIYINKIPLEDKLGNYQIRFIEQINHKENPFCKIYHLYPRGHILIPSYKEFSPIKSFSVVSDFDSKSKGYEYIVLEELKVALKFLQDYKPGESEKVEKAIGRNSNQWNKFIQMELERTHLEELKFMSVESKTDRRNFILKDGFEVKLEATTASPLLETKWSQRSPYWNWCPMFEGDRCLVGCTATAMAQIMRYYKWPKEGEGSHSYYWDSGNTWLSANFSDSYDWDYMPNESWEYDTWREEDAVAELCYEAGVSIDMNYGIDGSSAYTSDVAYALKTYFKYSDAAKIVRRRYYSNVDEWFDVLKGQRDLSRPLEFAIYRYDEDENKYYGHAVVVDGYLITDGLNQVHINMGWGGWYDAYYTLDDIYIYTDTYWQHAVIDIIPISQQRYSLIIAAGNGGTTDPAPGTYTYDSGTQVSITAKPNSGYRFSSWSGDASGSTNPITITMDSDKSIKANFIRQYTLTVASGSGGTTDPAPGAYTYDEGTKVDIKALPNSSYRFDRWTGDVTPGDKNDNPITITMNSDKSIEAIFIRQYNLTIKAKKGGTTSPSPGTYTYDKGTKVAIEATPDIYYIFNGWSGDISGKTNPITITMDSNKSITANFRLIYPPSNFTGQKVLNRSLSQAEYINVLNWEANPNNENINIFKYRIYQIEGDNQNLLVELNANTFEYWHRKVEKDESYTYAIVALSDENREGEAAIVTIQ